MMMDHRIFFPGIGIVVLCCMLCTLVAAPVASFTAQSLTITVGTDGNAQADFRYTLEGLVENAIPESMLEDQLKKGLATSDEPPDVTAFDKSGATLIMKHFAQLSDTSTGTEYLTESLDFTKAKQALDSSAVSSVITADFTPHTTAVIFPDGYTQTYTDSSLLPAIRHVVIDPSKKAATPTHTAAVTASATARATVKVTVNPTPKGTPAATPVTPNAEEPAETTALTPTTPPAAGMPVSIATVFVLALAGAGAYYYTSRK